MPPAALIGIVTVTKAGLMLSLSSEGHLNLKAKFYFDTVRVERSNTKKTRSIPSVETACP
jgi:hypothetical protein